jgi:hypothetical protein
MEQSSNSIAERTGFDKQRVMRALTKIRLVMIKDVPDIFSGTVEVDEPYLGGQWKNKRKSVRDQGTKQGRYHKNNRYLESSVVTVLSGPKSLMMLMLILFNPLSPKKCPRDLSFVQIPGKLTQVSLHVDTSIVLSIMVNDSTQMIKEITSTDWKGSGVILTYTCI